MAHEHLKPSAEVGDHEHVGEYTPQAHSVADCDATAIDENDVGLEEGSEDDQDGIDQDLLEDIVDTAELEPYKPEGERSCNAIRCCFANTDISSRRFRIP